MSTSLAIAPVARRICDLQTGFQILSGLPLADSQKAAVEINAFLDGLLQAPPPAEVYLQLLEQTRITLCFIAEGLAQRYVNKPLPLNDVEGGTFALVVGTWLKAARAYSHCAQLQRSDEQDGGREQLALILHRCIYYTGMAMIEHHRARQALPANLWLNLHSYYARAEELSVATQSVGDTFDSPGHNRHCAGAYVSLLLMELAGPYALSIRDLGLMRRWLNPWAPLVSVHPLLVEAPLPHYLLDLRRDCGLSGSNDNSLGDTWRRLDTTRLATQLNHVRKQLQSGISPAQLGLGEDCSAAHLHRLLKRLYKPWCVSRTARKFHRRSASGVARVATGFSAMHYHISGKEFRQPENTDSYSRREFESLFAFRHSLDPAQLLEVRQIQLGFGRDRWEVVDQSASGFRLLRSVAGRKIELGQLLSIGLKEGGENLLAQVAWLLQEPSGNLVAGVEALPGKPQAVRARPATATAGAVREYSRAFILPAVEAIGVEQTLILPPGWYRPECLLDVYGDDPIRVQLKRRVGEGSDFDRVSFVVV